MGNDHSRGTASRGAATGVRFCRRQSGRLEPALGPPGSATTHTGRYTTPRPSGKLHPQAVGGADGRYGGSPEGQTVTRAVPPFCADVDWISIKTLAARIWAFCAPIFPMWFSGWRLPAPGEALLDCGQQFVREHGVGGQPANGRTMRAGPHRAARCGPAPRLGTAWRRVCRQPEAVSVAVKGSWSALPGGSN